MSDPNRSAPNVGAGWRKQQLPPGRARCRCHDAAAPWRAGRPEKRAGTVAVVGGGGVGVAVIGSRGGGAADAAVPLWFLAFGGARTFGPGIAYQRDAPSLLLKRTADRMSILDESPGDFANW